MSFPKKGKVVPGGQQTGTAAKGGSIGQDVRFALAIAAALKRAVGDTHVAAKTVAMWSGANERTAKNWLAARSGPCGDHLIELVRQSDDVLEAVLVMSGRREILIAKKLADARVLLAEMVALMDRLMEEGAALQ